MDAVATEVAAMKARLGFTIAALTLLPRVPLAAQERALQPGQQVRVSYATAFGLRTVTGGLVALSPDTLRCTNRGDTVAVSLLHIERLQVSRGRRPPDPSRALKGAVRGAWPGAVILGIVALRCGDGGDYACLAPLTVGVLWMVVGGATGASRAASRPLELWEDVQLDSLRRRD